MISASHFLLGFHKIPIMTPIINALNQTELTECEEKLYCSYFGVIVSCLVETKVNSHLLIC